MKINFFSKSGLSSQRFRWILFAVIMLLFLSCKRENTGKTTVHLWHQMEPQNIKILKPLIRKFEAENPDIDIVALHKGTEEVRTGFQSAVAFAGGGPELVYGPMDQIGPFEVMKIKNSENSIIQPLELIFDKDYLNKFTELGLVEYKGHIYQIADRLGNHLALVYNKKLFEEAGLEHPPQTIGELIEFGKKLTLDSDGDGKIEQWGLVWNYNEPFWFIPFFSGYGGKVFDENNNPTLDSEAAIRAFNLIKDMRNKYKIIPEECDYTIADNMFSQGKAAMIINGDWSWSKYIESPEVEFGLAKIPYVEETGKWCAPMVSAKGYSINGYTKGKTLECTKRVLKFLTSKEVQREFSIRTKSIPSLKSLQKDKAVANDPVLKISSEQISVGQLMPIIPEMRAAWDAMRPALQSAVNGRLSAEKAARQQQNDCNAKIATMYEGTKEKSAEGENVKENSLIKHIFIFLGFCIGLYLTYLFVYKFILVLMRKPNSFETQDSRFAVILAIPAAILMFGVVLYPFVYNIIISLSNMNMTNVNSWQLVGFSQYIKVFSEKIFYSVFFKTIIWTIVNVFFHVVIGVFLALLLNRKLPGRGLIRVLLILPWAVPQYITALTWRGMFMSETGAINLILNHLGINAVNWLSEPTSAFIACIITNIWLGFPFMMMIALGALQSIPNELYEASEIDGATPWQKFWSVTVPLIKPVMIPAITLGIVWTFNNLNVMWLVSNGGQPADKTHILVSYVYRAAFNLYRYGYAAAFSMIIFILLAIFSINFMNKSQVTKKA